MVKYGWAPPRRLPDRIRSDGQPEYVFYLKTNGSGDEYRENPEVRARFFDAQGRPHSDMLERLRSDISELLYAPPRTLQLTKATGSSCRNRASPRGATR